jgi:hypothetical protein
MDNTLPYLFYTNAKIVTNNKNVFEKTLDETFTFQAQDVKFDMSNISITNYGVKFITCFKIKIHDKQYVYNFNL